MAKEGRRSIYMESKNRKDNDIIIKYYEADCYNKEEGPVLFAVCRAKFSEGYNFKDDLCRHIALIGVPNQAITAKYNCNPPSINEFLDYQSSNISFKVPRKSQKDFGNITTGRPSK